MGIRVRVCRRFLELRRRFGRVGRAQDGRRRGGDGVEGAMRGRDTVQGKALFPTRRSARRREPSPSCSSTAERKERDGRVFKVPRQGTKSAFGGQGAGTKVRSVVRAQGQKCVRWSGRGSKVRSVVRAQVKSAFGGQGVSQNDVRWSRL
jgi:hypothetical protein